MTNLTMIFLVIGIALAALMILLSLLGKMGPKWSQRWGNVIVVLSLLCLLIKGDAPAGSVWVPYLEPMSLLLGIIGAFWGVLGDVVCTAVRSKNGWRAALRDAVNE
ncbi:hypothetical protein [Stutzerimonas stutzeri]|jgi:hypothetical protein|uniref:Uncharacterized protein n=1 Tax=Stutzerimonas stutzeri TaxID=316 RepID=A0AA40RV85_STUST|nr:hypothetical protein [Stutzerimonas stutzeri]MBA1265440.1 hypothetical protein [Stutzerimonas stutzeri]MBA1306129.1 hypothetical protein [Stutzerimonas stutzeri]MBS9726421.1 hypothetical protein [Stutzerimonas stutzeri]